MKARVDTDACIGCGLCASMCDAVFSMNDHGVSEAIETEIENDILADAEEARDCCPVDAIVIED